jgi:hypothetical protein
MTKGGLHSKQPGGTLKGYQRHAACDVLAYLVIIVTGMHVSV